ncbi:MAG: cysteine hydrolase family protein [Candidatus Pristimantibacillus sp.]
MATDTALLVIDVQVGMFPDVDPVYDGDGLLQRIHSLITRARESHIPIVYIQHNEEEGEPLETNSPGWCIHPMIAPLAGDLIVEKHTPDAFHETILQQHLRSLGIHQLVLVGIQTDLCIDATCRRASQLEYEVTVAQDAHSTWGQGDQSAAQIIEHYNRQFESFATIRDSSSIEFTS